MKILIIFLTFSFLLLAQSKDFNNQSMKVDNKSLIPLKVGNCWYNKRIEFNRDGSNSKIKLDSIYIKKDTTINSKYGYFFSTDPNSIFYQDSVGLWVYIVNTKENSLFLKYPCAINDSWKVSISDINGNIIVKNLNEVVRIEDKTYKCIHYELRNESGQNSDIFVKPSIGFIKVILYKDNYKNMEVKLINFKLK